MSRKIKILMSIGTRPEAIKMASLIGVLREDSLFDLKICNTGQHEELLKPIIELFGINPDFGLKVMKPGAKIDETYSMIIFNISRILDSYNPDLLIVHGDTATTFASAFSAYLKRISIAHVEA